MNPDSLFTRMPENPARRFAPLLLSAVIMSGFVGTGSAQQDNDPVYHPDHPDAHPDATLLEIMDAIVMPAANVLWQAGSVVSSLVDGEIVTVDYTPQTDEEWEQLRWSAINLAESTNLMLIREREVAGPDAAPAPEGELNHAEIAALMQSDWAAWTVFADLLHQSALEAVRLIDNRDVDGLLELGGTIDTNCESCHQVFWYPGG